MKKTSAFTLIELMIVMAIIAVLATAGLSAYTGYLKKGRDTTRLSIASQVNTAVNALMGSNGGVPPKSVELIAYLDTMNMTETAMNVIQPQPLYLSTLSDTLGNFMGIPSLFAGTIREPSGGRAICLGYDSGGAVVGGQSCAFRYIVYSDGTYVIGYGVEHESSLQKNFYHIAAPTNTPEDTPATNPTPFFMQVVGTAGYVGTPSLGEDGGPTATASAPVFADSQVSVDEGGATVTVTSSSSIVEASSAQLSSTETTSGGGEETSCDPVCTEGETCTSGTCMCGTLPVCTGGAICTNNECVAPVTCGNGLMIGTYATVIAEDGECWLATNLTGHYQWMRNVSGLKAGWTANDLYDPERGDPCPQGSRMPTSIEWTALANAIPNFTSSYTVGTGSKTTIAANSALHLGIHGFLFSDGETHGTESTYGYYWSSTSSNTTYANSLWFVAGGVHPVQAENKATGFSVRCIVKE